MLSMSLSWWPCASTSAAMSRNTWCSSSRLFSISFTASCRSWISEMVSMICPRPSSWIAFWRKRLALPGRDDRLDRLLVGVLPGHQIGRAHV